MFKLLITRQMSKKNLSFSWVLVVFHYLKGNEIITYWAEHLGFLRLCEYVIDLLIATYYFHSCDLRFYYRC